MPGRPAKKTDKARACSAPRACEVNAVTGDCPRRATCAGPQI